MKRRKMVNLNGLAFIILLIGLFSIPKEVNGQSAEKEGEAAGTGTNDDGSAGNAGDDEAGGNDDQQTDGEKTETGDDKTEEEGSGDGGDENQQNNEEEAAGTGTGGETDEPKPEGQQGGNQGEEGGQESDGAGDETAPKDGSAETQDGVAGSQEDGNAGSKEEGSEDGGGKDEGVGEGTEKGSEETKPSTDGAGEGKGTNPPTEEGSKENPTGSHESGAGSEEGGNNGNGGEGNNGNEGGGDGDGGEGNLPNGNGNGGSSEEPNGPGETGRPRPGGTGNGPETSEEAGGGTGNGRPNPRPPSPNPPFPPPHVYPPVVDPDSDPQIGNPLPNQPIIYPQYPQTQPNVDMDLDNIEDDPFGFGIGRSAGRDGLGYGGGAVRPAPISSNNFADGLRPLQNGQRPIPGMTWVPQEERSQLPMVVSGNTQRRGGNWPLRDRPIPNNYGFGMDAGRGGGGRQLRYRSVPALGFDTFGADQQQFQGDQVGAIGGGRGGAGAVQRFPVLNGQNRVHLCIRPSPNTKYWDLWRYNNMSSVSPLQPYRQRLPPSQWLNENGQAYYAPYHVGDNRRVKRQANNINNNNMNWQDQVPQICTILQENINTNGFDRARQARKRRRRRRRAIHPSIINE